ncbi:DUF485 domain-containing protein [Methylobacterium sp. C25]|uniref:DUF485 domain-containing protein n=1 Tax=Methylobacterium sp. C25 TaxID=2721622 RepID=UPI001F3BF378|nr:DUF485 domain-containing protein [Methylobacterium sp. C25]MCE4222215.1 DUF485 domain-containing protein [Methylobacterium sp. C25]
MSAVQTAGSAASSTHAVQGGAPGGEAPDPRLERVTSNPTFQTLVSERTRFGWILTILMLVVYFGFIGLIAFDKQLLATKVSGTASLGLFLGVGVIVFAFILTGIYVTRANTRFDRLSAELVRSLAR